MKEVKDILIIHEYGSINGGASKVAIQSAIELANQGYRVTYFCACSPVDSELKANVYRVECLDQYDVLSNPSRLKAITQGIWNKEACSKLKECLKEFNQKTTVVHIHEWAHALSGSILKACNDMGYKPFITFHEYFCVCPNGGFYNYQKEKICKLEPMSLKCIMCNCDSRSYFHKMWRVARQIVQDKYIRNNERFHTIFISDFSLSKYQQYLKCKDFYFVHNPIEEFAMDKVDVKNKKKLAFIGRLSPEKGVNLFCEAVEKLGLNGIVIGSGPLESELKQQYKNIEFAGWKSKNEIVPVLMDVKALVFPSKWYEVAPLTTEECLIVGIPCIVPDECAASDYIRSGINGFIFRSGNVESLMEAIQKLDDNPCSGFAVSRYGVQEHVKKLVETYSKDS